jgi:hypothetical protein
MGTNIGFGVVKEFLPDMVRPFTKKRNAVPPTRSPASPRD